MKTPSCKHWHHVLLLCLCSVHLLPCTVLADPEPALKSPQDSQLKRYSAFRTDLGKRAEFVGDMADDDDELVKRFSSFRTDLGKRGDDELAIIACFSFPLNFRSYHVH